MKQGTVGFLLGAVALAGLVALGHISENREPDPTRRSRASDVGETVSGAIDSQDFGRRPAGLPEEYRPPPATINGAVLSSPVSGSIFAIDPRGQVVKSEAFDFDVLGDISVGEHIVGIGRSTPVLYGFDADLHLRSASPLPRASTAGYVGAAVVEVGPQDFVISYSTVDGAFVVRLSQGRFSEPLLVSDVDADHVTMCSPSDGVVAASLTDSTVLLDLDRMEIVSRVQIQEVAAGLSCQDDLVVTATYSEGTLYLLSPSGDVERLRNVLPSGTRTVVGFPDGFARLTESQHLEICRWPLDLCDVVEGPGFDYVQVADEMAVAVGHHDEIAVVSLASGEITWVRLEGVQPPIVG